MRKMGRFIACTLMVLVLLSGTLSASASVSVTYSGDAGAFDFQAGSDHSATDLFPAFKDVMPGDTLTQTIFIRNNASDKTGIKIYLRALGAHEQSEEVLSKLMLTVSVGDSTLFHAPADQTAQLSNWVNLGELGPRGEAELTVTLQVPTTLDSRFMDTVAVGYLDWQFMVEEYPMSQPDDPDQPVDPDTPIDPDQPDNPDQPDDPDQPGDPDKPDVPKTGDAINVGLFAGLFAGSGLLLVLLLWLLLRKKKEKKTQE